MNKLFNSVKFVIIAIAMMVSTQAFAQDSREFIRQQIEEWGQCRNVALTKTNGDLALYGQNGYAHMDCPEDLDKAIKSLHAEGEYIDDVQLTENGNWLILYGNNGVLWNNIPASLEAKVKEYNDANEVITSITFNDDGDWIIISQNYLAASDDEISNWMAEKIDEYGKVWAACVTDDALVVVYENGYRMLGDVPSDLGKALDNAEFNVFRLKISGSSWFIADVDGNNDYKM